MICYRDKTFCRSPGCQNKCGRKLTDKIREEARKWWLQVTKGREEDAPICTGEFCDDEGNIING